ncbi:MAG: glycosyltransferase [Prevotella sp.]|nr:glycosyltransferase [Prevotella sp.]
MKFSVTIPTYKCKFLQECIESVIAQTYTDFELIIVNDASPEDIASVIAHFDDPRIRYYVNERNCGSVNVVDNWNICLNYATGDYVICMGDDDKLLPCCLEEYGKLISQFPGLGVYHAWTEIIDEESNVVRMQEARPLRENVYSMLWHRLHGRVQYIGDFLFDTALLKKNGGFYKLPLAWGSDDISAYIAAKDTGIANMQVPGFQYRVNSHTISRTGNVDIKLLAINKEEQWYNEFLSVEPDENVDAVAHIFWQMLKQEMPISMKRKRYGLIVGDIAENGFSRFFHWLSHKSICRLSFCKLSFALAHAVKSKLSR